MLTKSLYLYSTYFTDMMKGWFVTGQWSCILLVHTQCTELLKIKYSKLCAKKIITDSIYSAANVSTFNALKFGLHELLN